MAAFQFQLQSLVGLRERERDQAAGAYKQALAAIEELQRQVSELQNEHDAQFPLQATAINAPGETRQVVDAQKILESQRYQMHLAQKIAGIHSQLELVQAESEKRRLRLVQREQALGTLEKLKQKQLQQWEAAQAKADQIALDEWASFRHFKSRADTFHSDEMPSNG